MAATKSSPDAVFKLTLPAGSAAWAAGAPWPSVVEAGDAPAQAASVRLKTKTSNIYIVFLLIDFSKQLRYSESIEVQLNKGLKFL